MNWRAKFDAGTSANTSKTAVTVTPGLTTVQGP